MIPTDVRVMIVVAVASVVAVVVVVDVNVVTFGVVAAFKIVM